MAILHSRFLDIFIENSRSLTGSSHCQERAEKLKRRLNKVCQYVGGITQLIEQAKQIFSGHVQISHYWVTNTFTGTGESQFYLCANVYEAVSRGLGNPPLPNRAMGELQAKLKELFPSMVNHWQGQGKFHARVHAELRIILHLQVGQPLVTGSPSIPIGVSKRSCFCCTLWITSHNNTFGTKFMTSGSHGKPYANWALQVPLVRMPCKMGGV
jgi:hypothetical protein